MPSNIRSYIKKEHFFLFFFVLVGTEIYDRQERKSRQARIAFAD
jgi:hypothetical protein